MIYQNSLMIDDENAHRYGCFVRSLLRVPEVLTGKNFTAAELNALFPRVVDLGYAHHGKEPTDRYIVDKPGKIVEEGFRWRDQDRRCYQTGIRDLSGTRYWGWVEQNPEYKQSAFTILKGQTVNHHAHFRLGDERGLQMFDPYHPAPKIQYEIYKTFYWLGDPK
jgi:hypothetical protein